MARAGLALAQVRLPTRRGAGGGQGRVFDKWLKPQDVEQPDGLLEYQLLADEGLIEEQGDDTPRKAFAATEAGRAELADKAEDVDALFERLTAHAEREQRGRSPHLFRAMGNLANVLKHRARSGTLDQEAVEQIVDMIDEMAKRIERL